MRSAPLELSPRLRQALAAAAGGAAASALASPAVAFPPYQSTDADTARLNSVELRVGLGQLALDHGRTEVLSPLLNLNFGLPRGFELNSELAYSPGWRALDDGAIGLKWAARVDDTLSLGVETLALLPVNRSMRGAGVSTQLLATVNREAYTLHLNGGGFHDRRGGAARSGWRASALAEFPRDDHRIGVELSGKDSNRGRTDVRAGAGLIYHLGRFDLRSGVHLGLTPAAPDIGINLWLTTSFPLPR